MNMSGPSPHHRSDSSRSVMALIAAIHLAADDVVLDFGVGRGERTLLIAEKLTEMNGLGVIISCDFSRSIIRDLKATAALNGLEKRIRPVCLSDIRAFTLPLAKEMTDCVLAVDSIHHLKKPLPYLKDINRILKPTGELIIADRTQVDVHPRTQESDAIHEPQHLQTILKDAGLAIRETIHLRGYTWVLRVTKTATVKRKTPISIIPISFPKLSYSS